MRLVSVRGSALLAAVLLLAVPSAAQFSERQARATEKLFGDAGGVSAIQRDTAGRYYLLAGRGNVVHVYDASGARLAQFPPAPPADTKSAPPDLVFGEDLDVRCPAAGAAPGEGCLIYIADRGGNAIRVFTPEGKLLRSIPVQNPTSVVALPDGEVAVTTMRSSRLVQVLGPEGKPLREFGVLVEIAQASDVNRFLNMGRLATDPGGSVYYAFSYVPEPTFRRYDRFGYAAYEAELNTLDFQPTAQAARREISKQDKAGRTPVLKKVISAIGVDPATQEVWIALGGLLMHFDAEGSRRGIYRIFTAEGARIEPTAILVEPQRLLLGSETSGVFELPRPDKQRR